MASKDTTTGWQDWSRREESGRTYAGVRADQAHALAKLCVELHPEAHAGGADVTLLGGEPALLGARVLGQASQVASVPAHRAGPAVHGPARGGWRLPGRALLPIDLRNLSTSASLLHRQLSLDSTDVRCAPVARCWSRGRSLATAILPCPAHLPPGAGAVAEGPGLFRHLQAILLCYTHATGEASDVCALPCSL